MIYHLLCAELISDQQPHRQSPDEADINMLADDLSSCVPMVMLLLRMQWTIA